MSQKKYRYSFISLALISLVVYLILITGHVIDHSYGIQQSWVQLFLGSFFYRIHILGSLLMLSVVIYWACPVVLTVDSLKTSNVLGFPVSVPFTDLRAPQKKYFLGIPYFSFSTKKKRILSPVVWGYLRNLREFLSEVEARIER